MRSARRFGGLVLLLLAGLATPASGGSMPELTVQPGEPFPDMELDGLAAPEDYRGLGLERTQGPLRLSEIPGELLILEFFNRFCLTCQRQAPFLAQVFQRVQEGDMAGRVRVLAVGVGNRPRDLRRFRQAHGAVYPMAADPLFERFLELGDPGGTPFTVFLLRKEGRWILVDFHLGLQGDTEILAQARVILEGRAEVVRVEPSERAERHHPPLGLDEQEQAARARALLRRVAGRDVGVDAVEVDGVRVYRALGPDGRPTGLFARIASRDPVCDVCHAVHFLLAFDAEGRVRGFEPIHVTKFGNEVWSSHDAARMEARLVGRPMERLAFDPDVDAVTSATMSSALIFDEARRTAPLVPKLLQGLR